MTKIAMVCLSFFLFTAGTASAQLSQLDFDRKAVTERQLELEKERIKELQRLEEAERAAHAEAMRAEEAKKKREREEAVRLAAAKEKASRARMKRPPAATAKKAKHASSPQAAKKNGSGHEVMLDGAAGDAEFARFLAPSSRGPALDDGSENAITSKARWSTDGSAKCWEISAEDQLRKKADALAEILNRYSGDDAFHRSLVDLFCAPRCEETKKTAVMTGMSLLDAGGGNFEIIPLDNACAYRFTRGEKPEWPVLEGRKAVCHCL